MHPHTYLSVRSNLYFGLIHETPDTAMINSNFFCLSHTQLHWIQNFLIPWNKDNRRQVTISFSNSIAIALLFKFTFYITFLTIVKTLTRSWVTQTDCDCAGHHSGAGDCFRVNWPMLTLTPRIFFRISLFLTSSILTFSPLSASCLTTLLTFFKAKIHLRWNLCFLQ